MCKDISNAINKYIEANEIEKREVILTNLNKLFYDFDKCIYVTAYEQNLHFKQIFEVAKYLVDEKYTKGLEHVSYGMVNLPTGTPSDQMSTSRKVRLLGLPLVPGLLL